MSYSRTTWIPEETPLSADNFNNIEDGIEELMAQTSSLDNQKVDKVTGKGLSTNDYTTAEKNKLAGIAEGATANTVTNSLTSTSTTAALSAAQGKVLNDTKAPNSNATTSAAGLMSAADKTKLNGITASAKNVKVVNRTSATVSIEAGAYKSVLIGASETGWTLIGVVGYSIDGSFSTHIAASQCTVSNNNIYMVLRNYGSHTAEVYVNVIALYIA